MSVACIVFRLSLFTAQQAQLSWYRIIVRPFSTHPSPLFFLPLASAQSRSSEHFLPFRHSSCFVPPSQDVRLCPVKSPLSSGSLSRILFTPYCISFYQFLIRRQPTIASPRYANSQAVHTPLTSADDRQTWIARTLSINETLLLFHGVLLPSQHHAQDLPSGQSLISIKSNSSGDGRISAQWPSCYFNMDGRRRSDSIGRKSLWHELATDFSKTLPNEDPKCVSQKT